MIEKEAAQFPGKFNEVVMLHWVGLETLWEEYWPFFSIPF
jgi:hypothetical protein